MDAVEEIKSRLSIEDVVSQYLELKRSGRNFKALSPFSHEKSASLMVSPEKQIWHDFSSGKGGDMFTFVMEVDGLDFKGALDLLARQAGVDLTQFQRQGDGKAAKQKEEIYEVLEIAAKFYQVHLSRSKTIMDYVLNQRQFTKKTAGMFRLGYSPNKDAALVDYLRSKGYKDALLKTAGLGTQRYRGFGDMFRNRLMVPLQDGTGRVIGFTARQIVTDPNGPKYINTPQSPVYDKSRHVYGFHLAKDSIRKNNFAVVVEGNLDVVASHQAEVANVVATAGTALTEEHLKALSRFTTDIRLAFDQDDAGLRATERAIPIAAKVGVSLSMVSVPAGKDPDELVKKDPQAWRDVINQPEYAVDWIISRYQQLLDLTSAQGKRQFSDRVLSVINDLSDSVERDHYLGKIAKMLEVSVDALRNKTSTMNEAAKPKRPAPALKEAPKQPVLDRVVADQIRAQNKFLSVIFFLPSLRSYLDPLITDMFLEEQAKKLVQFLKANPDFNTENLKDQKDKTDVEPLRELADYVKVLSLIYEELYRDLEVIELRYEAARLQIRQIETYVKTQKARLATAMNTASDADMERLLEAAKRLDVMLKTAKEASK